jgi:hypothetical protein
MRVNYAAMIGRNADAHNFRNVLFIDHYGFLEAMLMLTISALSFLNSL